MAILEMKVDEIYKIEQGLKAIEDEIKKKRAVDLINLPHSLIFVRLRPLLKDKTVKIYINNPYEAEDYMDVGEVIFTSVEMLGNYKGEIVRKGEVFLDGIIYNVWWNEREIVNIGSISFNRCVRCITNMHKDIIHSEELDVLNNMTIYEAKEGIEAIVKAVRESKRVRMVSLPRVVVKRIFPLLKEKELKIICAWEDFALKEKEEGFSVRMPGDILNVYSVYKGIRTVCGGIAV
ncbi:MAG: hypothetical protein AB1488_03190, partial [Nitrospirota bacterium]